LQARLKNPFANWITKNFQVNERSKHIDIAEHYILELVDRKKIKLHHIRPEQMIADCLTKWPFKPRRLPVPPGEARLQWQCVGCYNPAIYSRTC
jgi:hypothetical protein